MAGYRGFLESLITNNTEKYAKGGIVSSLLSLLFPKKERNLSTHVINRDRHGNKTWGVWDDEIGEWAGTLGKGLKGTRKGRGVAEGSYNPYILQEGDKFNDESYERVNKYLQSDKYKEFREIAEGG
jgi:hypothetical protein